MSGGPNETLSVVVSVPEIVRAAERRSSFGWSWHGALETVRGASFAAGVIAGAGEPSRRIAEGGTRRPGGRVSDRALRTAPLHRLDLLLETGSVGRERRA